MKGLKYLSEITGYEKIVEVYGREGAERLNKEIEYFGYMPQKRFEIVYSSGGISKIYVIYCGMYTVEEYLGII